MAEKYLDNFELEGVKLPIRDVEGRKLLVEFMGTIEQTVEALDNKVDTNVQNLTQSVGALDNKIDTNVQQITQSVETLDNKVDTNVQNLTQEIAKANEKIDNNNVTISYDENSEMLIFEKGA